MNSGIEMTHADFKKAGIIYGFQPVGRLPGTTAHVYCFGRSARKAALSATTVTKRREVLRHHQTGLNRCERILYWKHTTDLETSWDALKQRLRGNPVATHLHQIGDNWFSSEMGPDAFALWLQAPAQYVRPSEEDLQKIAAELDEIRIQAAGELGPDGGLRVQAAGDELVIGPVSSQFAARAVLGMIEARLN